MATTAKPKILHVAAAIADAPGVARQMEMEQFAANESGLDWRSVLFVPRAGRAESSVVMPVESGGTLGPAQWWKFRRQVAQKTIELMDDRDIVLYRYPPSDLNLRNIRRAARSKTLLSVHHALEAKELAVLGGRFGVVRGALEDQLAPLQLKGWDGVIGVTHEIAEFQEDRLELPKGRAFIYPNGVAFVDPPAADSRGDLPELVFLASAFHPWQGLDRLRRAVAGSRAKFRLHLIGSLSEEQRAGCASDTRIELHGNLHREAVLDLLARAWVGVAGLAFDRSHLSQACPLKTRDYLAAGVPVVSGHDDVFPGDFPYYRRTGTDIEAILAAAHEWRSVDRATVREAARPHIDKVELVRRLHGELVAAFASADD